jgi:TonB family protein
LAFRCSSLRQISANIGVLVACGAVSASAMIEPAFLPVPIERPAPAYPPSLRTNQVDGKAEVEVVVGADGTVKAANVLKATDPRFGAAAVAGLFRWRFLPGTKAGVPTEMSLQIPINFRAADPILPELPAEVRRDLPAGDERYPLVDIARVDQPPALRTSVRPVYPAEAGENGPAGQATVDFVVDEKGQTRHLRVVAATETRFALPAAVAVSQWFFAPGQIGERLVRTHLQIAIDFRRPQREALALPNAGTDLAPEDTSYPTLDIAEVDFRPHLRESTKAIYPEEFRKGGKEGRAMIDLIVDENGAPRNIRVAKATYPAFGDAAAQAVAHWIFSPGSKEGKTVRTHLQIPVIFNVTSQQWPAFTR